MTADEIRNSTMFASGFKEGVSLAIAEVAAQLAEQNEKLERIITCLTDISGVK